ncbi:hypothetical protein QE152_g8562 [Popillia japonica]|uniref:Uncharacterized protein n=1 Tax=Popillia japonica TaxID=7064 RepID=A0AAW1MC60_POPJA
MYDLLEGIEMSSKKRSSANLRKYKTYSSDSLAKALDSVKNEGMNDINRSILINHLKNCKCGPVVRPTILNQEEEQHIVRILMTLAEWGFGIDRFQLKILV